LAPDQLEERILLIQHMAADPTNPHRLSERDWRTVDKMRRGNLQREAIIGEPHLGAALPTEKAKSGVMSMKKSAPLVYDTADPSRAKAIRSARSSGDKKPVRITSPRRIQKIA
jgi:hypothetical protein